MMAIGLLQELGLNKYEAEAYYTLLAQGPLTGYELGKRSQVPLSRSYDVLERLSQKGLALAQPGEPARYQALELTLVLGQVRSTMEETLHTLNETLTAIRPPEVSSEFWVIRGQRHILTRAQALCATATRTIALALPRAFRGMLEASLEEARQRGVSLAITEPGGPFTIELLVDQREALLGSLAPEEACQAVLSGNPALVTALTTSLAPEAPAEAVESIGAASSPPSPPDWLDWEKRKQQRLRKNRADQRSA